MNPPVSKNKGNKKYKLMVSYTKSIHDLINKDGDKVEHIDELRQATIIRKKVRTENIKRNLIRDTAPYFYLERN